MTESNTQEDLSQKLLTAVGKEKLKAFSYRQPDLMDQIQLRLDHEF